MNPKVALLLGASGSVGFEVLKELMRAPAFSKVVVFVRKPLDAALPSAKLVTQVVPAMTTTALSQAVTAALAEFPNSEIMAFSALGIGANTAKLTLEQHRAIDVSLNQAFASALARAPQVKSLQHLSAMGANPKARTTGSGAAGMARYNRVKGEAEEAVKTHGPNTVRIFRPAIIRGSQHTPKAIDWAAPIFDYLIPKKYHSISTEELARAMVAASLSGSPSATYTYEEMRPLLQQR